MTHGNELFGLLLVAIVVWAIVRRNETLGNPRPVSYWAPRPYYDVPALVVIIVFVLILWQAHLL